MLKVLLLLAHAIVLYYFSCMNADQGISLAVVIPQVLTVSQESPISVRISKGTLAGFGRLEIRLPPGITLKETENADGAFTFEDGLAHWDWSALPGSEDFVIAGELISSGQAIGTQRIEAKFYYIEENEKKETDVISSEVTVQGTGQASGNTEPSVQMSALRKTEIRDGECMVTLSLHKGATKGFARYSDILPPGIAARTGSTEGGSFSTSEGKIKFIWVNVPEKEDMEISYYLKSSPGTEVRLNGEYSYLENNQSRKFVLEQDTINFPGKSPAQSAKAEGKPSNARATTVAHLHGEGALSYHIQIGAFKSVQVKASKLKKQYRLTAQVNSEMHQGLFKFMTGNHRDYKLARVHRNEIKNSNGVASPFVVAYNHGKRITVQEALMISNQKWVR